MSNCHNLHQWYEWRGQEPPGEAVTCHHCLAAYRSCVAMPSQTAPDVAHANIFRRLCPADYRDVDLALLPDRRAYDRVLAWQYGPRGIIAHGITRRGKSRAMWQLIRRLVSEDRHIVVFGGVDFGHEVMARCGVDPAEFVGWIRRLALVDVMFFDDLGKLKLTERAESELFGLVEARIGQRKPILATMNMTHASLVKRFAADRGEPFVARLREKCDCVGFTKGG